MDEIAPVGSAEILMGSGENCVSGSVSSNLINLNSLSYIKEKEKERDINKFS